MLDFTRQALTLPDNDLLQLCEINNFQGSGPGGQKRNRIYSGVRLKLKKICLQVTSAEFRETERNKKSAIQKLRLSIAQNSTRLYELPPPGSPDFDSFRDIFLTDLPDNWPTFRAKVNPDHRDFPCFVFTSLNLFKIYGGDLRAASSQLNISSSALVRFFKLNKAVWNDVQNIRNFNQLSPLK